MLKEQRLNEIKNEISNALKSGDTEKFIENQLELSKFYEAKTLEEAKAYAEGLGVDTETNEILTREEKEYYNEVIDLASFDKVDRVVPTTVYEKVFEDLRQKHKLLEMIDFKNTFGLTEFVVRDETKDGQSATWGEITSEVTKKIEGGFKVIRTNLSKLSAYIPISKAMLDLGPVWIDRYLKEVLTEAIAIGLETAIVTGDGNNKPIGMTRNLSGAVVAGAYPEKTATALNNFKPSTLGKEIMAKLTKGGKRAVNNAIILVNPVDYWSKIFAETTFLTADKVYVHGVLPIPATIIESSAVPEGKLIAGLGSDYLLTFNGSQRIEYSDHVKFIQDQRVYLTKHYITGTPKDNDSFLVFDISAFVPSA